MSCFTFCFLLFYINGFNPCFAKVWCFSIFKFSMCYCCGPFDLSLLYLIILFKMASKTDVMKWHINWDTKRHCYTTDSGMLFVKNVQIWQIEVIPLTINIEIKVSFIVNIYIYLRVWGRRCRDRMAVSFTTTYAISACHH